MLTPSSQWSIDTGAALQAFAGYVGAVAVHDYLAANAHRIELEALGLLILWQPGRSRKACEAAGLTFPNPRKPLHSDPAKKERPGAPTPGRSKAQVGRSMGSTPPSDLSITPRAAE